MQNVNAFDPISTRAAVVRLANCRWPFGGSMRFDAIVDGSYPDRTASIWLSQAGNRRWSSVYVAIPEATVECAWIVANAITRYHVGNVCKDDVPIDVRLCWPGAPDLGWQITV